MSIHDAHTVIDLDTSADLARERDMRAAIQDELMAIAHKLALAQGLIADAEHEARAWRGLATGLAVAVVVAVIAVVVLAVR